MKKSRDALEGVVRLLNDFEWKMRRDSSSVSEETGKAFSDAKIFLSQTIMDLREDESCDASSLSVKRERAYDDAELGRMKERKVSESGIEMKSIFCASSKSMLMEDADVQETGLATKLKPTSEVESGNSLCIVGKECATESKGKEGNEEEAQSTMDDDKAQESDVDAEDDEDAGNDDEDLVSSDEESSSFNPLCKPRHGLRDRTNEIQDMTSPLLKKLAKKIPGSIPLFPKLRKKDSCESLS
jgi:hypothetical protein